MAVFFGGGVLAGLLMLAFNLTVPSIAPMLALQLVGFGAWMAIAMWTTMYGVTHLEAGRSGVLLVAELVVAAVSAMLIVVFARQLSVLGGPAWLTQLGQLAWPWYVPLGTFLCVATGVALSYLPHRRMASSTI